MASDLDVLDPTGETLTISGREFTQRALGLRGTAAFIEVLATTVADTGNFDVFNKLGEVDVNDPNSIDIEKMFPILLQVLRLIPEALPRLISICLRAPDDVEFLAEYVTPITALKIVKTFVVQNDVPQLMRDFTEVAAMFGTLTGPKVETVPEPVEESAS